MDHMSMFPMDQGEKQGRLYPIIFPTGFCPGERWPERVPEYFMSTQFAAAVPKVLAPVVKEHQFPNKEDMDSELRLLNKLLISNTY